jgi:hypothetical protein
MVLPSQRDIIRVEHPLVAISAQRATQGPKPQSLKRPERQSPFTFSFRKPKKAVPFI